MAQATRAVEFLGQYCIVLAFQALTCSLKKSDEFLNESHAKTSSPIFQWLNLMIQFLVISQVNVDQLELEG